MSRKDSRGRVHRTSSEKLSLISAYKRSGKSVDTFCAEHGVGRSTLRKWLLAEKQSPGNSGGTTSEDGFIRLSPVSPKVSQVTAARIQREKRLEFELGTILRLSYSWSER